MFDPRRMQDVAAQGNKLVTDIGGIRDILNLQTTILESLNDAANKIEDPKVNPLAQFLDLTMANPTLSTDAAFSVVGGWISAAGAVEQVLHLGEAGNFFHYWLPAGGIITMLPLLIEAPWIVSRGQRIWIETITQAQDFHCKLVVLRNES